MGKGKGKALRGGWGGQVREAGSETVVTPQAGLSKCGGRVYRELELVA